MTDPSAKKPFAGIRILDFTRYLAGPFGTYQLALLGAELIKIEPKAGDEMRFTWDDIGAVASALFQRSHTGLGQFVDVAMLDAALSFLSPQIAEYTVTGHKHRQYGNLSTTGKVTGSRFKAGEGDLMLSVMTEKQFSNLMRALGREGALDDPRFADWPSRTENEPALRAIIEEVLAGDSARNWETRLTAADVPCAAIWAISEIVHHPQLDHREVLQHVDSPNGPLTLAGSGFRLEHDGGGIDRPPPTLGEHTDEVLAEAGYDAREIKALREEGVV